MTISKFNKAQSQCPLRKLLIQRDTKLFYFFNLSIFIKFSEYIICKEDYIIFNKIASVVFIFKNI